MRKDKEKVLDEVWTGDRIRGFLEVRAHDGTADDFHMLFKAYQGMRAEDFAAFVAMFSAEQRDINSRDRRGMSVLDIVRQHRRGSEYAAILEAAGAR
jgi:hypothetical protein